MYGDKEYVIRAGTLGLRLEEANELTLEKQIPIEDSEGMALSGFNFSLVNEGKIDTDYTIYLDDIALDSGETRMPDSAIRYSLTRNNVVGEAKDLESMGANPNRILEVGSVAADETVNYTLKIWLDYDATTEEASGKTFKAKLRVEASQAEIKTASEVLVAKANAEDLDYTAATSEQQKEMWTFSHPETEQTEALTDYRYIGADPNNYVTFNDETWRIIGVFTVDDGTGKKEERLKIIRDESIGNYSWDNKDTTTGAGTDHGKNDWSDARLNYLLNPEHEAESVGGSLYWNSGSGTCYSGASNATTNCDFTETGLKEATKNMIGDAVWYLGGVGNYVGISNGLTSHFYSYERGTTVYSGNATSWLGKVGLIYPSDYGYATSGGSITDRNSCLNKELYNWKDSSYSDCKNNNWLYNSSVQWTMIPLTSGSNSVFCLNTSGHLFHVIARSTSYTIHPVVFLKSSVKIDSGDGSASNPYVFKS